MKALPLSDAVQSLPPLIEAYVVLPTGAVRKETIHSIRTDRESLLISFQGIVSREEAAMLRNAVIEIDAALLPALGKDEYYYHQIIGLLVVTAEGETVGRVTEIMETSGNEVYVVQSAGKEYLIPAVKSIIAGIDLEEGKMIITPIEGLLD